MGKKAGGNKKVAQAPKVAQTDKVEKVVKPVLFEKKARSFRIGGDIQPKRNLTKFVKWPLFIQLQRKKRIMLQRLKVPPALAQFAHTLDRNQCNQLFRILKKIAPETRAQKKERLQAEAATREAGGEVQKKTPIVVKFGLNHVVSLVEDKKAKLVVIAHDVDPVELVAFLPTLCRKKGIPYCVVKSKSRLGSLCNQKTASCLAVTNVKPEEHKDFANFCNTMKESFNDNSEKWRKVGGGIMGNKSQHVERKKLEIIKREEAKKLGVQVGMNA